jgi:glycolate dehydrogenase FAD-binding subunit
LTYHPAHIARLEVEIPAAPDTGLHVAPKTTADVESILRYATEKGIVVQVWGGGTHSGFGDPPEPGLVMSMERLGTVEHWEPDDLTIVVGAGAPIEDVEASLNERNQTLGLPERPGAATIGGVVAAGVSGLRRGRMYATRERVLEVTMITGDGRIVRSGGRVVKNVSGYDLHRLAVGAFGSLGVILSVCLKLWPTPPGRMTVRVDSVDQASVIVRPLAVLDVDGEVRVYLQGTEDEVASQARRLGGTATPGHDWPEDPAGAWRWSLRVPPAATDEAVSLLPDGWSHVAVHGVGDIRAASATMDGADRLRDWAESLGGALVMVAGDPARLDPWGAPPPGLEIQRRLIAQFDPGRILNPGRLPGGI